MKWMKIHVVLVVLTMTTWSFSCKKNNATSDAGDISNQLTASTWSIHYLLYNTDVTAQFTSYVFTFKKDSTVTVTNSIEAYSGIWFTQKQSDNSVSLQIQINSTSNIRYINNYWKIVGNDGALITMVDYTNTSREFHLFRR